MPPRRSSRLSNQLEQRQSDPARPPVSSFDQEEEEEVPFLQDDWWTSAAGIIDHSQALDFVVQPFLHFPNESQNTLTGICSGPPAATAAAAAATATAAATPKPAPRRKDNSSSALGLNANRKPISSHVMSERQRRKGMNHLFATLAVLLPENAPKGDKSTIVNQIILYIQSLQGELEELSKKRALRSKREETRTRTDSAPPRSFRTTSTVKAGPMDSSLSPNVVFSVCGPDAFVTMSADSGHSLLARALTTLQQHRLEVLDGNISSSGSLMFYYFHAKVPNGFQVPQDQDLVQTALQRLPLLEAVTSSPSAAAST